MIPNNVQQFTTLRQIVRRGSAHLLVLKAVSEGPIHGYDVARKITELSGGLYVPSAGMIYPTLQWLQDNGYVMVFPQDGKNFYRITEPGLRYLDERAIGVKEIIDHLKNLKKEPEYVVLSSASRLQRTIAALLATANYEEKKVIARILDDANERIIGLLR